MANKTFPQKYKKKLNEFAQGYEESAEAATTDDIKKLILTAEQNIFEIEHEMDNNASLLKLKEDLKKDMAPFSEAKATEMAKIKFCLWVLDERGVKI